VGVLQAEHRRDEAGLPRSEDRLLDRARVGASRAGLDESGAKAALESVFSLRARDVEAQSHVLKRMVDDPRVNSAKLVVVDTVTKNFSLEFPDREKVGRRQGALGVYLNRIALDAYLHRRVVLLINRVASVTRNGVSQDVNVGGLTLARFVSKSVRLRREGGYVSANVESPRDAGQPIRCKLSEKGFE
jgi:RecA/RadA recombinase